MIKSYAKINVFLKVVGKRGNYHEIISRFVRINKLYDEIEFLPKISGVKEFEIAGNFNCETKSNTIYKAYELLRNESKTVEQFFESHIVSVKKNIPFGGGLGGGSSNAAAFLLYTNATLNLKLSLKELCAIGEKIGADVNFFLHECEAANVSGIGEVVEPLKDDIPDIELVFDNAACDTALVYKTFREQCRIDGSAARELAALSSKEALQRFKNEELNDLLRSVLICYPSLKPKADAGLYLSGSGSTFFKVI